MGFICNYDFLMFRSPTQEKLRMNKAKSQANYNRSMKNFAHYKILFLISIFHQKSSDVANDANLIDNSKFFPPNEKEKKKQVLNRSDYYSSFIIILIAHLHMTLPLSSINLLVFFLCVCCQFIFVSIFL